MSLCPCSCIAKHAVQYWLNYGFSTLSVPSLPYRATRKGKPVGSLPLCLSHVDGSSETLASIHRILAEFFLDAQDLIELGQTL
jgi:hypothetical protein